MIPFTLSERSESKGCARSLLLLFALLAGCSNEAYQHLPEIKPSAVRAAFVPPAGLKVLKLGLVPYVSEATMRATHGRLAAHLAKELGVELELVVGASYDDVGDLLAKGTIDFAELSPYVYVRTKERVKLRPLVMAIADGSDTAASYIVVRRDSPYSVVEDLKGATFGFVDRASTTGFLYPRKYLREHGVDPEKDITSEVLGNHEAVLSAVLEGKVAAGGTYQGAFAALRLSKGIDPLTFRVIGKTARSPRDLYVARADLAPELGDALTRLLLDVSSRTAEGRDLLGPMGINGYVPANDIAYAEVERAHKAEVGVAP
jgi:phosphonate transport system substrate-binding protein